MAATIPPKRSTRVSQASPDPARASAPTPMRSSLSFKDLASKVFGVLLSSPPPDSALDLLLIPSPGTHLPTAPDTRSVTPPRPRCPTHGPELSGQPSPFLGKADLSGRDRKSHFGARPRSSAPPRKFQHCPTPPVPSTATGTLLMRICLADQHTALGGRAQSEGDRSAKCTCRHRDPVRSCPRVPGARRRQEGVIDRGVATTRPPLMPLEVSVLVGRRSWRAG